MRNLLTDLRLTLNELCPTFLQTPIHPIYPYIIIEPGQSLKGLPWGPHIALLSIKIWSRYKGTREILKIAKHAENILEHYAPKILEARLKLIESTLVLLKDEQTRLHTFRLKARYQGDSHE